MTDYFLSFFNLIHEYTQKEEKHLKNKLKTKYNKDFENLIVLLKEYISSEKNDEDKINDENNGKENENKDNNKKENENKINNAINDYISVQKFKYILDKNTDITLKEKYIDFIIYYMKQFDDNKSSLYDLKISKLDEIVNEEINENENDKDKDKDINNNVKEEKANESIKDISLEIYNNNINSVLVVIKQLMKDENKEFRELFSESIETIENTNTDIISLESFINELNKKDITLNSLQISCFNKKYCINEELHSLEIKQIEEDVNNFKKK